MPVTLQNPTCRISVRWWTVVTRGLVVPLSVVLSGCVATDYKPAITTFAGAMKRADETFAEYQSATNVVYQDLQSRRIVAAGSPVSYYRGAEDRDCGIGSTRCRLVWLDRAGKQTQFTGLQVAEELRDLTRALVTYADKLAAIVNAETAKNVGANLAAAKGSINETAEAVNKAEPGSVDVAAFTSVSEPIANLATWAIGEYVNHLQVAALRTATTNADPVVQAIANSFGKLGKANDPKGDALRNDVVDQTNEFEVDRRSAGKLDRLRQAAEKYDAYLVMQKNEVFQEMGKAHAKLTAQLDGRDVTLADAERAIQSFATKAEGLWKIIEQFKKIGETKQASK